MRIFLTGATGYVGSAILGGLLRAGHQITALVRDDNKAAYVRSRGAEPWIGALDAPSSYRDASGHDVYIHAALDSSERAEEIDRLAIESLTALTRHASNPALIYTSGTWILGNTSGAAAEDAPLRPHAAWRPEHERLVLDASQSGLRTIVVRPGILYGGGRGIIGDMFNEARGGELRVVGNGENHWAMIYDRDVAELYAGLVTRQDASGIYHATDEGDERVRDVADAIAAHPAFRATVRHVPLAEARAQLGRTADALALDQIVRSPRARALGWMPTMRSVARNVGRLLEEWRAGREAA